MDPEHWKKIKAAFNDAVELDALAIWKQFGAQSVLGIAQPNKIAVLERKIARSTV